MYDQKLVISISDCLSLWADSSSVEVTDKKSPSRLKKKVKIGRDSKGNLLSVGFKYLKDKEIEIYSAFKL